MTDTNAATAEVDLASTPSNDNDPALDKALKLVKGTENEVADQAPEPEAPKAEVQPPEEEEEKTPYSKSFNQLAKREKAITAKEAEIADREKRYAPLMNAEKLLREDPADFLVQALEALDPENHSVMLEEAFTKLSMKLLGVEAPKELQEQSQYHKLQREFENYKKEQARKEQEKEEQLTNAQYSAKVSQAHSQIRSNLDPAKHSFLMNQDEWKPEALVWEIISHDYETNLAAGKENYQPMSIEAAAALANEHYQNVAQKWARMVSPPPTPNPATNGNKTKTTATLTNAMASQAPARQRIDSDSEEERIRRALELIK